ncbi:MAG: hypothetical protein H7257_06620 [Taibaiella sp.]|nr:hypothetical protein [Taibaiella sp.]
MKIDKYPLSSEQTFTVFKFISEGHNGIIHKIIQYQETNEHGLYNLAFGDFDIGSSFLNDTTVSNNGDTEKILATVVSSLYAFCDVYPSAFVYATGSTISRIRLYRMGISKYYNEIIMDFHVYGQVGDSFYEFELGKEYQGFLAQRKFT